MVKGKMALGKTDELLSLVKEVKRPRACRN